MQIIRNTCTAIPAVLDDPCDGSGDGPGNVCGLGATESMQRIIQIIQL